MKRILIFKTDRVGDLINITPVINNIKLNYNDCNIDLICSKYNSQIANYIPQLNNIFIFNNSILKFLKIYFNKILSTKYDVIFQLDGKNHSYLLSLIFQSTKKYSLKFIKQKKFLGKNYKLTRPNFFYQYFIDTIECKEDYNLSDNKSYHYLTLYLKLLKKADFDIVNKNHVLNYKPIIKVVNFKNDYIHFHIDEKSLNLNSIVQNNLVKFLKSISSSNNIAITSNLGENPIFDLLCNEFKKNKNFLFFKSPVFSDLISIVYFSKTCISSHSGFIVHLAACYNKNIIDIVNKNIFNELDRWIPFNINYKRIDIEELDKNNDIA